MKKTMPISLSTLRNGIAAGGKSAADAPGASQPSSDGPSRMPATTSPITCGCWTARNAAPSSRATAMMTRDLEGQNEQQVIEIGGRHGIASDSCDA